MIHLKTFSDCYKKLAEFNKNLEINNEYVHLKEQKEIIDKRIKEIEFERITILDEISDSKRYLLAEANEKKLDEIGDYKVKWKEKKEVDTAKLFSVVGDVDAFVSIASVTQKDLKSYAKERSDLKKPLMGCISVTSREAVDLI